MEQLTYVAAGCLEWHEAPEPGLQSPGEALVRPLAVATCDLDPWIVRGRTPFPAPIALGHECVARVEAISGDVATFEPGDLVVVPFQISCGACEPCRQGRTGNCSTVPLLSMYGFGAFGGDWGGALSDLLRVPFADEMLVALPDGVEPATAASVGDNIVDGWRAVAPQLDDHPGAEVLIVGGGGPGSIGLYAAGIAVALGASRVDYLDHDQDRLERADRLGANPIDSDLTGRFGPYPITVDASGDEDGLALALRCTAADGACISTSIHFAAIKPLPLLEMYTRCVTLHVGRCHARAGIPHVLELLAHRNLAAEVVTARVVAWGDAPDVLLGDERKYVITREPA